MSNAVIYHARHGALCHLGQDRVIGAALRAYGEWAEEEIFFLSRVLRPGALVLDVGANVGTHSLAFSRLVGDTGQVLAFDGQRRAFTLLTTNMLLNRADNVTCHNVLVGARAGISFAAERGPVDPDNLGSMSFVADRDPVADPHGDREPPCLAPVVAITLDSLRLQRCDLLKIDVEGMELDVLRGAVATLQRHNPTIYFEQTGAAGLAEIGQLLRALGYSLHWHVANPFNRANFAGNPDNIFGPTREVNVVAVHGSRRDVAQALGVSRLPVVTSAFIDLDDGAEAGWTLPRDAYQDLAPPFAHRVFGQTFDAVLPGSSRWLAGSSDETVRLSADFRNLLEDRRKAQEIMEHLSDRVTTLSSELDRAQHRLQVAEG